MPYDPSEPQQADLSNGSSQLERSLQAAEPVSSSPSLKEINDQRDRRVRRRQMASVGTVIATVAIAASAVVVFDGPNAMETATSATDVTPTSVVEDELAQRSYLEVEVPAGLWISEIVPILADELPTVSVADLEQELDEEAINSPIKLEGLTSWEGLLAPGTYQFEEGADASTVIQAMSGELTKTTTELGFDAAAERKELEPYELLIVASLVEAEARTDRDRSKIAQVIYNRLQLDMPIGIDASTIYDLGDRTVELSASDLEAESPYNLRSDGGLPPTPISAPSRESLQAAANPTEGDWLYYVPADAQGNMFFTADLNEFADQVFKSREAGFS